MQEKRPKKSMSPKFCINLDFCTPSLMAMHSIIAFGVQSDKLKLKLTSSARKLIWWLIVAATAWAAHHAGLTITQMEAHMEASLTFKVHGEAYGVVGPVGVR
jgi:hypothetical protein